MIFIYWDHLNKPEHFVENYDISNFFVYNQENPEGDLESKQLSSIQK